MVSKERKKLKHDKRFNLWISSAEMGTCFEGVTAAAEVLPAVADEVSSIGAGSTWSSRSDTLALDFGDAVNSSVETAAPLTFTEIAEVHSWSHRWGRSMSF